MPRIQLSDDLTCTPYRPMIALDEDCVGSIVEVEEVPIRMKVMARTMTGRTTNGDPIYAWTALYEDVPVVILHHRQEASDGYPIVKLKITAPYLGEDVSERCAIELTGLPDDSPLETVVYRVTSVENTMGKQTYLEAERQLDV